MLAVTCVSCPSRGSSLLLWGPGVTWCRGRSSTCLSTTSRSQIFLLPSVSLASWSHITLAGACPATGDAGVPVWPAPAPELVSGCPCPPSHLPGRPLHPLFPFHGGLLPSGDGAAGPAVGSALPPCVVPSSARVEASFLLVPLLREPGRPDSQQMNFRKRQGE